MKIYKNQAEVEKDVVNGHLNVAHDVTFESSVTIDADIMVWNLTAKDLNVRNIDAENITAGIILAGNILTGNINAGSIAALDIVASDITAYDITARDIVAGNIDAADINAADIVSGNIAAANINAENIEYWAVCFACGNIVCKTIKGDRENAKHFALDGKVKIGGAL